MAEDPVKPNTDNPAPSTADLKAATQSMNELSESLRKSKVDLDKLKESWNGLEKTTGTGAILVDPKQPEVIKSVTAEVGKMGVLADVSGKIMSVITKVAQAGGDAAGSILTSSIFGSLEKKLGLSQGMFKELAGKALEVGEVLGKAGAPIAITQLAKKAYDQLGPVKDLYNAYQENFLGIDKIMRQSRIAFREFGEDVGKDLGSAEKSGDGFAKQIVGIQQVTRRDLGEITGATKDLSEVMGVTNTTTTAGYEKQGGALGALARKYQGLGAEITPVNAAMLLANATGMGTKEITGMMGKAYQELGEDVKGSMDAFGRISEAAEGSGLSMSVVSKTIFQSAEALKMWGGSINSVTPLFNMFSKSLEQGRKGLAPELLQTFTQGIEKMSFAQRAFIGIQGGVGKGPGGALGAGLEMEEALEDKTGKGTKKYVDSITKTLEQFGGGKVITRQDAIKDPALQSQFMVQRGLLEKMGMSSDPAVQNKILKALQDAGKNGMQAGSDSQKAFSNLLKQGGETADKDTAVQTKFNQASVQATITSGTRIVKAIEKVMGPGLIQKLDTITKDIEGTIRKGEVDGGDFKKIGRHVKNVISGKPSEPQQASTSSTTLEDINRSGKAARDIANQKTKPGETGVTGKTARDLLDNGVGNRKDAPKGYAGESLVGKAPNVRRDSVVSALNEKRGHQNEMPKSEVNAAGRNAKPNLAAEQNQAVQATTRSKVQQQEINKGTQQKQQTQEVPLNIRLTLDGDFLKQKVTEQITHVVTLSTNSGGG
jgi:hypothetical protein